MNLRIFLILCTVVIIEGFPKEVKIDANIVFPELNEIPNENLDEPKGFLQRIQDSVKGYVADKVENLFKDLKVECESKRKKSGKLIATKTGKEFCQSRCREIYSKIDKARETIAWLQTHISIGKNFDLKRRENQHLPEYKCALNLPKTKLICDCPKAPEFSFGKSIKKYLQETILTPSNAKRSHHHHHYNNYGPFGGFHGGYGGYQGAGYYTGTLAELISMIFYPMKILFFIVTLPLWMFLAFFIGMELDAIF